MCICSFLACSCIVHVENVDQEFIAVEEEAGAEGQEELQEYEVADPAEEPAPEANFANSESQQGKPRFIWKPNVTTISLRLTITTMFMH